MQRHSNLLSYCYPTFNDPLIIDEASMIPVHSLHAIDKLLRDLSVVDIPFGGKIFLLGGDFRQVLPVMPRGSRTTIVENCIKRSPLWPLLTIMRLTQNMRAQQLRSTGICEMGAIKS